MESMDEYMEWIHSTWNPPGMWGQGKLLHNLQVSNSIWSRDGNNSLNCGQE